MFGLMYVPRCYRPNGHLSLMFLTFHDNWGTLWSSLFICFSTRRSWIKVCLPNRIHTFHPEGRGHQKGQTDILLNFNETTSFKRLNYVTKRFPSLFFFTHNALGCESVHLVHTRRTKSEDKDWREHNLFFKLNLTSLLSIYFFPCKSQ